MWMHYNTNQPPALLIYMTTVQVAGLVGPQIVFVAVLNVVCTPTPCLLCGLPVVACAVANTTAVDITCYRPSPGGWPTSFSVNVTARGGATGCMSSSSSSATVTKTDKPVLSITPSFSLNQSTPVTVGTSDSWKAWVVTISNTNSAANSTVRVVSPDNCRTVPQQPATAGMLGCSAARAVVTTVVVHTQCTHVKACTAEATRVCQPQPSPLPHLTTVQSSGFVPQSTRAHKQAWTPVPLHACLGALVLFEPNPLQWNWCIQCHRLDACLGHLLATCLSAQAALSLCIDHNCHACCFTAALDWMLLLCVHSCARGQCDHQLHPATWRLELNIHCGGCCFSWHTHMRGHSQQLHHRVLDPPAQCDHHRPRQQHGLCKWPCLIHLSCKQQCWWLPDNHCIRTAWSCLHWPPATR